MFPEIIDTTFVALSQKQEQLVCAFSDGTLVIGFELSVFDFETDDVEVIEAQLREFVKNLPPNILARLMLTTEKEVSFGEKVSFSHSRQKAIEEIGFIKSRAFLFFEREQPFFLKNLFSNPKKIFLDDAKAFLSSIRLNHFISVQAILRPLVLSDFLSLMPFGTGLLENEENTSEKKEKGGFSPVKQSQPINIGSCYVDFGTYIEGVLKLIKQSTYEISIHTLTEIKDLLPVPNKIVLTIKTQSSQKTETWLRRKSNQAEVGSDAIFQKRYEKIQTDLEKVATSGGKVLSIELQVVLQRGSEEVLRKEANDCIHSLRGIGEFYFETIGVRPAWHSAQIGARQHVPFLELDEAIPSYMPVFSLGHSYLKLKLDGITKSSLLLHRRDDSVGKFDLFNGNYDSYSTCIFGAPGSGKSVLTNMITRALAHDENIFITKLDVGGSHSRETSLLGGQEFSFSIDTPTGHNPFRYLTKSCSSELIQILGSFLEVLVKEEGEVTLTKSMKSDIEHCLSYYQELKPNDPNIDDFLTKVADFPRKKLLQRWSSSGIFKNAFCEVESKEQIFFNQDIRLKYFNFAKISQALDSDFSQGGLAAVMSAFNFDMLVNRKNRRFVFIADEVPIFIQKCFSFFALSIANIRKNGDAFVTIAQRSEHVVVDHNTSILDNSPSKFIFTVDGTEDDFSKRLHLDVHEVQAIKNLQRIQGQYSEVFHMDQLGKRIYRIVLSPNEYWSYTSKREDKDKIEALLKIPGFTIKEAIKCLSV